MNIENPTSIFSIINHYKKWLIIGILLTFYASFGQNFYISIFGGEIRAQFSITSGEFGLLYAFVTLGSAFVLIWLGQLSDHYSVRSLACFSLLGIAASSLLLSQSQNVTFLFLALFGLRLFGQGMLMHVALTAISRWFSNSARGKAISIASLGNPIGEATLPILAIFLSTWFHWQSLWLFAFLFCGLIAAPLIFWLLKNEPPLGTQVDTRRDDHRERTALHAQQQDYSLRAVLKSPTLYLILPGLLSPLFINTAIFFHQVTLSNSKQWQAAWFVAHYPLAALSNILSVIVIGWLIDRVRAKILMPVTILPMIIALLLLAFSDSVATISFYMILAGLSMGAVIPIVSALLVDLYGMKHLGSIRALVKACSIFLSALGPALMGFAIDFHISFQEQFLTLAVYLIFCGLLFLINHRLTYRRKAL